MMQVHYIMCMIHTRGLAWQAGATKMTKFSVISGFPKYLALAPFLTPAHSFSVYHAFYA